MENFYKLILRGINTIYLIWSTSLSILCDYDLTFSVAQSYQGELTIEA